MGRRVAIVGAGATDRTPKYTRNDDQRSWRELIADAAYDCFESVDKGINPKDIQYVVTNYHGEATVEAGGIGPEVADSLGIVPSGVTQLCANCTGGGVSLHDAYAMVSCNIYDRVLVLGWDRRWDILQFGDKRAIAFDVEYDYNFGYDHGHAGLLIDQLQYRKYGIRNVLEASVTFIIQNYWYANRNPKAIWYGVQCPPWFTKEKMMALWDAGEKKEFWKRFRKAYYPMPEAASALLLVPAEEAKKYTDTPVYIDGVAYKCTPHYLTSQMRYPVPLVNKFDFSDHAAAWVSTEEAMRMAKVQPENVDFAEVFDMMIGILLPHLESLKICPRGGAAKFIIDGETAIDGRLPCGTHGGLGGFGKTSGSDVTDCVWEVFQQMRCQAGKRQIPKYDVAVAKGTGGHMAKSATIVFRRE